jgi:hypothetical protein
VVIPAMMAGVEEVEVVVAHSERATQRVGDVFLKIDADQTRTDVEVEAMAMAPVPTPEVLWGKPPVLAFAALPGDGARAPRRAIGRDLASLTLGHKEHLGDVVAGYGTDVDLDVIRAWWSLRSLQAGRWLIEHGFDPSSPGGEFDVLRSQM